MKYFSLFLLINLTLVSAEESRPIFKGYRFDDNNSALKEYEGKYLGRIKEIPLFSQVKLDIGGDLRLTNELHRFPDFGSVGIETDGYLLQRYGLHLNLTGPDEWRIFSQFKYSKVTGKVGRASPLDNDNPDVQQLFLDKKINLENSALTARAGRQEVTVGSGRFIALREGPNSRASFDGIRLITDFNKKQIDFVAARPVSITPGPFDNKADSTNLLITLYGVRLINEDWYSVDASALYFDRDEAIYGGVLGEEERYSLGTRVLTVTDQFKTDTDVLLQGGSFKQNDILAYGVTSEFQWEVSRDVLYVINKLSYFSGDHSPTDSKLNTFNSPYAKAGYYGWSNLIGYSNLIAIQPGFSYRLVPSLLFVADYGMYWRQSLKDNLYRGIGSPIILPLSDPNKRFSGSQLNSYLRIDLSLLTSLAFEYSYFFHAGYTKPYRDSQFLASRFLIKF